MTRFYLLFKTFLCCITFIIISEIIHAQTIYVTASGAGDQSGSSWANAAPGTQLKNAINNAASGSQIWVSAGTYKPTTGTDRNASFSMKEGVAVYGGFTGSETALNQRPAITFSQPSTTILSGDIGNSNDNSDNSLHVVYNFENGLSSAAILDGFIINNGNANGSGTFDSWGGGVFNRSASPSIRNCVFENNSATVGGAMDNTLNAPFITNCYFQNNSAQIGGAIAGSSCSATITNCIFFNNSSDQWGGAIYNFFSSNTYINCTFSHNSTGNYSYGGGAIRNNQGDHPTLINCILWGNFPNQLDDNNGSSSTIKNSDIDQDGWAGQNGNIRQDPFFIDITNGNLKVLDCSMAMNKGDDASNTTDKDIDGNPRKNGTIDMGALENQNTPTIPTLIIAQPPARDTVNKGGNVTITVDISGPVVAYQWYKDGQPVNGQTTATLSLTNVQASQAGNYTLKISGSCNTLTSNVVTLIVPARFYVNAAVATSGDGTSWGTAFKTLQEAFIPSAIEVWVAAGIYKPTTGADRGASFYIPSSLKVYGSFAGTETNLTERSLNPSNRSILSGDVGGNAVWEESSEHVVVFDNVNDQTLLDGFEITNGHSFGYAGGGGIYITGGNSNPVIENCIIKNNSAQMGGGVYSENYAYNGTTTNNPAFVNCTFSQNTSANEGGAVYISGPDFSNYNYTYNNFTNCSFTQNTATEGGAIYSFDFNGEVRINLTNCIVWNNTGGGLSNLFDFYNAYNTNSSDIDNQDPLFVDAVNGDLHLQACSPVINAGDNGANSTDKELDGNPRIAGSAIDMGAYEFQGQTGPVAIINMPQPVTVCSGAQVKFSVTATGGNLTFQWKKGGNNIDGATDSVYSIATAALADAGDYSVIVSGCGSPVTSDAARLTVNTAQTPVVTVADNCGSSTLSATAEGNLLWSTGATTSSIIVNNAGNYTVTQMINGCTSNIGSGTAAPKTIPPTPVVTISDNCGSSTLSTNATGSLLWNTGETAPSITVSNTGSYSVTQTANGCTSDAGSGTAAPKTIPSAPVVTISDNCGSSILSTNATGSLLWNTGATAPSITVSNTGSYSVTQTANGCTSDAGSGTAAPKAISSAPVVTVSDNCGSSILSTNATGSLLWSTGATTSSITVITAGNYSVTQTVNGCTSNAGSGTATPKTIPPTPVVTISDNCGSSTLSTNATGSLLWNTGETAPSITVSNTGSYSVTQTINGCTSDAGSGTAAPKTIPSAPVVTVSDNCGSSILSTNATGSLLWSTGATTSSITVITAGNYSVTQTINGCTSDAGSGTAAPKAISSAPVVTVSDNCGSSILSTNATGSLLWSTGATTSSITVITAGNYSVTQTVNGCTSNSGSGTATPGTPPATPEVTVVNSCGSSTLTIPAGGSILWSNGATTASITVTTAGTYKVSRTVNGCTSAQGSGTAAPKKAPAAPVVGVLNTCGISTLSTICTGGSLLWSNGLTAPVIIVTTPGTYTVTQTVNGCTSAPGSGIAGPKAIPATPVVTVSNNCGSSVLSTTATGSLLWSTGANTASITTSNAGIYSVIQTVNGCPGLPGLGIAAPNKAPSLTATNITVNTALTSCSASVSFGSNVTVTGSPAPTVAYKIGSTAITSPYTFPVGSTTVSVTATNSCGTATKTFIVTVKDDQSPVITCKPGATKTVSGSAYTVSGTEFNATATDNCGTPSLIYSLSGATVGAYKSTNTSLAGVKLNVGTTTITWKATDASSNVSTCNTVVKVNKSNVYSAVAAKLDTNKTVAKLLVKVAPNPSSYYFTLQLKSGSREKCILIVLDAVGRTIEQQSDIDANSTLQIGSTYRPGTYVALILQGSDKVALKLIKEGN